MNRFHFAPAAECDLNAIWRYVARKQSADAADRVYDEINAGIERVTVHPLIGEAVPNFSGLRRVVVRRMLCITDRRNTGSLWFESYTERAITALF